MVTGDYCGKKGRKDRVRDTWQHDGREGDGGGREREEV